MFIGCSASYPHFEKTLMVAGLRMLQSADLAQGVSLAASVEEDHAFLVTGFVLHFPGAFPCIVVTAILPA